MRRGATALAPCSTPPHPQAGCAALECGEHLPGWGGRGEAGGLQSHSSETNSKAAGMSFRQVWTVQGTGEELWQQAGWWAQPPALRLAAPSPAEPQPPRVGGRGCFTGARSSLRLPQPTAPAVDHTLAAPAHSGTEQCVPWGAGAAKGLGEDAPHMQHVPVPHGCLQSG